MNKKYRSLIIWIVVIQVVGIAIGSISGGKSYWYINLTKSQLTPPSIVFPIAWTLLYITIALAGWLIWSRQDSISESINERHTSTSKKYFIVQMLANWLWSPLFFYFHSPVLALACIIIIIFATASVITVNFKKNKNVSLVLLPYILWSCFAFYLNFFIVLKN